MTNMSLGLSITIIGLITVFLVLILLWGYISLMKIFSVKNKETSARVDTHISEAPIMQAGAKIEDSTEYEGEVVAVIMAAIANCLNTSTYRLNIKSIKRVPNHVPAWNAAARHENINHQI